METGLSISNPHPRRLPGPELLHELVPRDHQEGVAAVEHAVEDGSIISLGYGELHEKAEALARRIAEVVKRCQHQRDRFIVPILIPQSLDLYISQLASLKAGGAFCPIVLDAPEERLRFILQDTGASVLLTTTSFQPQLPTFDGIEIIAVDDGHQTTDSEPLNRHIRPQDAAYVMYTSGSTGKPKGVIISHSAVSQALLAHDEHIPKFSRFLQFASPTFDVSVFEIFFPWYRQRTLISCDRRRLLNDLPAAINDLRIDACELTPSVASSLLRGRASVPSLKVLLTIGEMLKPSVVEDFGGSASEIAILHGMYGPTEATIHCTLQTSFPKDMACGTIGSPLETVSAFVVKIPDENSSQSPALEILKLGEEGELAVGGHQLADGYLNREEQTKAAFVEHPEYGLLYRTGDRARMLPDGKLECLGRISNGQVKLRGQRIELGEVEHAASRTSGCRDVVAEVIQGILVVFCVAENATATKSSVLKTCRKWLPSFMVPGEVIILDALPYLASGKCDRKALRQRHAESQDDDEDESAQYSETTRRVVDVLVHVLGTEVNARSSLPGLGVDSLLSIRITASLRKAGFRQLDATEILSANTPLDIAQMLNGGEQNHDEAMVNRPHRKAVKEALTQAMSAESLLELEDYFPCTPTQIAMLAETHKQADAYCNWAEFQVARSFSLSNLTEAIRELIRAHPMLRSGFVPINSTQWSFATVIWQESRPQQVRETATFNHDFALENEEDLLHPCSFQLMLTQEGVRILFQAHHAVYDQWSSDLLRVHLDAILEGQRIQTPTSFGLVADYHAEMLQEGVLPSTMDFWQQALRDASPTTLPLLQAQQVPPSLSRTSWRETNQDSSSLRSLSQQLKCSPPAILQAAWALLLGSYTGTPDITFGSVFSGRNIPVTGVDEVFGPCLTTLPLRIDTDTANTCADLVGALTERTRAMQKHIWTPPTSIRQAAGIMPGATLFDTLFIWQESIFSEKLERSGVEMIDSQDRLEFNLVLEFEPTPANIKMRATYQQSIISLEQVDVLLQQLDALVSVISASPQSPLKDVWSTISPDVLSIANPNPSTYSDMFELTSVIQRHAAGNPSATAILFAEALSDEGFRTTSISYSELDARANRMAHHFIAAGLNPEGLVCICMEKCIDLYVAMLASFKAGAGYLPLVPDTPSARVKAVLGQVSTDLCVCDADTIQLFERLTTAPVIDISNANVSKFPSTPPAVTQVGSRISYAVFTSGSTGEPKGVAVTMDNLKGNLGVLGELYQVQTGDRLLQACSQAFDVSVFEIFFAFYSGMCLCTATKEIMFHDFEGSIRNLQATHLSLTPTVAALVQPENVPSVKFLVTAGEGITEKVHLLWSGKGLHQGYGPSETTNICSVKMNHSPRDVLGNIGPPFRNTSAFVLSPSDEFSILPAGAYGEYAFGGEQVFRGYIGRDDLNSVKIINHPQYGRVYKSGDMGRILPDGTLLIAGRLDDQVKIRGNRVELGEINAIVSDHPEVLDCTTIVLGEGSTTQTLVTFFVPVSSRQHSSSSLSVVDVSSSTTSEIFSRLEDALPSYMLPSTLLPVNELPITSQGKLDKRLLQQALNSLSSSDRDKLSRSHQVSSGDAPASPMEAAMAEKLAQVLEVPVANISRDTSFFALGLNSLNAMQFARLLQKSLKAVLGVTAVMKHSSIARLAQAISGSSSGDIVEDMNNDLEIFSADVLQEIQSSLARRDLQVEAILPCTPLQEAMLSASVSKRGEAYCNTTKLSVSGDLDKLRSIWDNMMERHAILRTTFVGTTSAFYPYAQVVSRTPFQVWQNVRKDSTEANGMPNGHTNGYTNGHTTHMPKLPSATPESPFAIYQDGHELYLQMHHAIYDGISVANLFAEMEQLYRAEELPPPVSFEPFLAEVMRQNGDQARQFWSQRFRGFYPSLFPQQKEMVEESEAVLDRTVAIEAQYLQAFCARHGCTTLSVFQAAWVKTLACAQQVSDLCFGNVVSGRSVPVADVDRLVAPCFNTVPLRSQVQHVRTNLGLIQDLHRINIDTLPFQLTGPRQIQALSQTPSQHLFDSLLLLQPEQEESDLWRVEEDSMDMGIPLALEIIPRDDAHELFLHYMPSAVSHALASSLADGFVAALMSCVRYASSAPDHFLNFEKRRIEGRLQSENKSTIANGKHDDAAFDDREWTETEEAIRKAFSKLAGVERERISKQTSLYRIGLDSLNAVQVASVLRQQGFKLDAADVMQYQTPTALASFLDSKQNDGTPQRAAVNLSAFDRKHRAKIAKDLNLDEDLVEAVRPCTPTQSGMLAQFIQAQGALYMGHSVYSIPKSVSFEAVRAAWAAVEHKHKVLRMGFYQTDDANTPFAMAIYKPGQLFDKVDLSHSLPEAASFEQYAREDVIEALHLPAWRLYLDASREHRKMCLSLHHALYDADSLQILLTDFSKAIRGQSLGPVVEIDQAIVCQIAGAGENKAVAEKFWKETLESSRTVKFPNLTPTIVTESSANTIRHSSNISMATVDDFCRAKGVTIQALGQTAWAMLLAQYLGEPEVTFGTVFSGSFSTSQAVAFPAISTLPVYCNTSKDTANIIHDMVTYNASIQRHRFTPLADIQRYAGSAGQALFDTIFVYQKSAEDAESRFDWQAITDDLGIDYIASLEMETPDSGNVQLRLTHDMQSIPADHASLMVRQFDSILRGILEVDQDRAKEIDLLSFAPPKVASIPCSVDLLHQFVERGAKNHPDAPALEFIYALEGGEKSRKKWTYKQLEERSNQVANLIQQRGVKPGGIVAVCMAKCAEASFAFVGILKAGCAFLAMDPDLPPARRSFIMEDSESQLLFVDAGKLDEELDKVVPNVELTEDLLSKLPSSPVSVPAIRPDSTSYCLYTSGTTGTPKGCELTHENAVQAMMSFQRLFAGHWDQNSRWLQFASYWFDVSVLEQFWSWSVGITVVGAPRDVVLEDLAGFIQQANITHIDLTPSLARLLTPDQVPSLHNHVFITGGEALKQEIIDRWGPYETICNGYGPTEATIGVTMNPFIGKDAKPSNIGPPFDNVGAYVFAPGTDEIVLRGAVGELCVSGKLVGKGYLNRPDLTAKAFPYLERHGERVYRTGDLVRLLADGSVSFTGRADTQAKLRGQRLEIDEIDSVIKSSASTISDVASLVVKSKEGSREMLVSFIVNDNVRSKEMHTSTTDDSLELVQQADQACRDRLPGYMVPTHIIPLTRLPLTVNNKVDTKRLVALFESMTTQDLQQLKGSNATRRELQPTEQKIAEVLARLLSIEASDMTPDSNFFSLGLSSVSAINFATALKRSGLKDVSVAMIMKHPSIQGLSRALSKDNEEGQAERNAVKQSQLTMSAFARRHRGTVMKILSVEASQIEAVAPCTPLQEGLLVESMKSDRRPYFNQFWYDVTAMDIARLIVALERLKELVPMLRTVFLNTDEGFAQAVLREKSWRPEAVEVKDDNFEDVLKQRKRDWIQSATYDSLRPLEVSIVKSSEKTVLAFHAHHALYDGFSWDLMMGRLEQVYQSTNIIDCGPSFIEALPYGPLCHRPEARSFWQQRLQDTQFVPLAAESGAAKDGNGDLFTSKTLRFETNLEAVRRDLAVSHQAVLQAAFTIALHQLSPRTQSFGLVLSGRSISFDRADEVIGPMFNTIPYAVDLNDTDGWKELLLRCQQSNAAVVPFQHTPLRDIRKFCGRHPSDPMFDVLFVFQRPNGTDQESPFKPIETNSSAEYPLAVEIELDGSNKMTITIAAQKQYATTASLDKLAANIEAALDCIAQSIDQKISNKFNVETQRSSGMHHGESTQIPQLDGATDFEWTPEATSIRQSIAELAGCETDDVTEYTGIFTLGLDSIDAVKLGSRLKKAGLSIPVSQILKAQTIPKMLEASQSNKVESSTPSADTKLATLERQLEALLKTLDEDVQERIERILPATPGQEALVADMIRSEFGQYYNSDVLRINDDVDTDRLKAAWQAVVDASPILRTSFVEAANPDIEAVFAQVVHRPTKVQFTELSAATVEELSDYIEQTRINVMSTLATESPFRLGLAKVQTQPFLVISMAHAQYDGHSLALLHEDVAKAYSGVFKPRPIYDAAVDLALDATTDKALHFWKDTLSGAQVTRITDIEEPPTARTHRAERAISITASKARTFCKSHGVSLQALTQATWALLLSSYTKHLEVIFGIVLACRDSEEAEAILFPAMNTIPMRASLHGTGSDMVRYIQGINNDARPYQRTPLRAIQSACSGVVQLPNSPPAQGGLFDSLFIYQQRPDEGEDQPSLYESVNTNSNVEYPVAVEGEAVGDELIVRVACKSHVFDERGTRSLLQKFDHVLDYLVKTPEKPTVSFSNDLVSICGLPGFKLKDDVLVGKTNDNGPIDETSNSDAELPDESDIRAALAQVAKVSEDEVSSYTKMEAIGIDSISAIKVTALLRKQSIKLPVSSILKAQTPRRMAELVESNTATPASTTSSMELIQKHLNGIDAARVAEANGIDPDNVESVLPATAGQLYMLFMWRKTDGELFYPTFSYRLKTQGHHEDIKAAWNEVVSRNPILRTVLVPGHNKTPLLQLVFKQPSRSMSQPMVDFQLKKTGDGHTISLGIHHALYDAVSLPLLMQELESALDGTSPQTPRITFQDFVASALSPEAQAAKEDFWTRYLRDARPATLKQPKSAATRKVQIFRPQAFTSCSGLEKHCRAAGVSVQALLFGIYAKIYASLASQGQDVVFGIYLANRSHLPELDRLAAPTLNLLPLLVRSPQTTDLIELAKKIDSDLRDIGSTAPSSASLAEIADWTGVKVESFVNFLKLPEQNDTSISENPGTRIEAIEEWTQDTSHVIEPERPGKDSMPAELRHFKPDDAYQHAVDVELSMANGKLSIGLFCLEEMLGLQEAERFAGEMVRGLEGVVEGKD
ncbi:hypothetical protein PRZ48_012866 [Zasmidium cellare]|uniref:Carrier domain-containing protein n=1 Tax=Zasmidium cellare TaxID=395010 RepID=A0ABR0E3A1_ZASCE|nr:hypothetical protein PRZ48_012866 [Zasmidium cellare]